MGCNKSSIEAVDEKLPLNNIDAKNHDQKKNVDNGEANALPPQPPKVNPYLKLSNKDIYHLKASWKGIRRMMEETGVLIFVKLFQTNNEFVKYFEKFTSVEKESLFKSNILTNHASIVMAQLDKALSEIDQAEVCHANLLKVGVDHKKRGIKDFFFWEVREPFLRAVETILGDRYTEHMRTIYEVFIEYLIKTLIEGFNS